MDSLDRQVVVRLLKVSQVAVTLASEIMTAPVNADGMVVTIESLQHKLSKAVSLIRSRKE